MFQGVSLDQAPPFEAPLLFFLTAPLFAIVGVFAVLFGADELGVLHAFTIGFAAFVMIGALQQMLPVVVGVKFENPKRLSLLVYVPLVVGTILLMATLGFGWLSVAYAAAAFLLVALGGFALTTLYKLLKAPRKSDSVVAMILSLMSLFIAASLGVHLLISLARNEAVELVFAHASFALFGWVGLLIVGISYQVIPMFYVTKEILFKRWIAPALFILIFIFAFTLKLWLFWLINTLFFAYAMVTLWSLYKRKRSIKEPSIGFWQFGLAILAIATFLPEPNEKYIILFGYGFAMSVIYGMLYKIIPFLSWFHTSSRGFFDIPTMKEMLNEKFAYFHLILHILSTLFLLFEPQVASGLIVAENLLFYFILKQPLSIYFEYKKRPSPMESFKMP